jgi:hypothetical protein
MGTEFQSGKMKMFWRWMVVMAAQQEHVLHATELSVKQGIVAHTCNPSFLGG